MKIVICSSCGHRFIKPSEIVYKPLHKDWEPTEQHVYNCPCGLGIISIAANEPRLIGEPPRPYGDYRCIIVPFDHHKNC